MRICIVGGGPAGLYFALLTKAAHPDWQLVVHERNRAGETFGWGVVFSDETMGHFAEADPVTHRQISDRFIRWSNIDTFLEDHCETSTGHGFCGIARRDLLEILGARCRELGVELRYDSDIGDYEKLAASHDLLVAADGINSRCRSHFAGQFSPKIEEGLAKYIWLGTDLGLDAFTFFVRAHAGGVFQAHAYPFQAGRGTFIVETSEEAWRQAGFDGASVEASIEKLSNIFERDLRGAKLLSNRSQWISFRHVTNERWHHENIVLIGDAAHTAHFSIGSGTKLAMEDAIALHNAIEHNAEPPSDSARGRSLREALAHYQESRWVEVAKLQKTARTSQAWFENCQRYYKQAPIQFTANLLMRSKRVTHGNLRLRDANFIERLDRHFAELPPTHANPPQPMFKPLTLRSLTLHNRVVVSPMCQYSAEHGLVDDWHLVHLGSRAVGGAGLIIAEMTAVSEQARITPGCAGIYNDDHTEAWARIVDFIHRRSSSKVALQLGHAGRKGACSLPWAGNRPLPNDSTWPLWSASPLAYAPGHQTPRAMTSADMQSVIEDYVAAAQRAQQAGFDALEIHMAHGYLLASFISPLTNRREDEYGGNIESRMRFPLELFAAVRRVWPEQAPIMVRLSASDWAPGGLSERELLVAGRLLKEAGCDLLDVSSGQTVPEQTPEYGRMYQTKFSDLLRHGLEMPTMAVGAITSADQVNTILATGRADLCALARPHLADPYLTMRAADAAGDVNFEWPKPYLAARKSTPGRR